MGEDYHRRLSDFGMISQPGQHLQAADTGHLQIQQQKQRQGEFHPIRISTLAAQIVDDLAAILHHDDVISKTGLLEGQTQQLHVVRIIVRHKYRSRVRCHNGKLTAKFSSAKAFCTMRLEIPDQSRRRKKRRGFLPAFRELTTLPEPWTLLTVRQNAPKNMKTLKS